MRCLKLTLLACAFGACLTAQATNYQLVMLDDGGLLSSVPYGYAAGGHVAALATSYNYQSVAQYWSSPTATPIDLSPPGSMYGAQLWGCSAVDQVGEYFPAPNQFHAILWSGSPTNYIDLNPNQWPNVAFSYASGTNGVQQVGITGFNTNYIFHATVWSGTAASAVDIHPSSQYPNDSSSAFRIADNGMICGTISGNASDGYFSHACYWQNSSSQAVDLSNATWTSCEAFGTDGTLVAGFGSNGNGGALHALVWNGTADSVVDLGPGQALDCKNGMEVGYSTSNGGYQAAVWQGTPDSIQILPVNSYYGAIATAMGTDGVIAGYIFTFYGPSYPVLWVPMASDTTPPTISNVSVSQSSIWPPNKSMIPITVNYSVSDNVDSPANIATSLSVSCNESVAAKGMVVVDANHVLLVADRNASGTGRVYTITITATDRAGNVSTSTVTVTVPHDQGA